MSKNRYYIQITESEKQFRFHLWYCRKQAMGSSKAYSSLEECIVGMNSFKEYLSKNKSQNFTEIAKIIRLDNGMYCYQFYDEKGMTIYTSRGIEAKVNCQKSMRSTYKNFPDADFKGYEVK